MELVEHTQSASKVTSISRKFSSSPLHASELCSAATQVSTSENESNRKYENCELLKTNEVLRGRYKVESKLARGGCSQIYRGYDLVKCKPVAVKVATSRIDPRRMKIEQIVLTILRGKNHFVSLIGMGQIRGAPYLIMELVGHNLSDIRRRLPGRHFQPITVYRISMQVMSALHDLHSFGFLHRDIKPSNLCIGRGINRRMIYLVDYGMARMFMEIDGRARSPRKHVGFRGTPHYVSLAVHSRRETGPCDDLIGWFYSMVFAVELINGKLPWSNFKSIKDIEISKKKEGLESLCKNHPKTSLEFVKLSEI
ncbi:unnamed protein product [Thelazia callipaeda]|uniref:non-specific serine/threonine protein kinase n=1 Tax=Thelazia callipaeda TaxID=103827 RepID=A0A0N5D3C9_THECL|nr:unnamed protein product [Thelazia callipaeda]